MSNVSRIPFPVQPTNPRDAWPAWTDRDHWMPADLPAFLLPEVEPFHPSREDQDHDSRWTIAYESGRSVGLISDVSEPPADFEPWERDAYARGFARGEAEDHEDTLAWIAEQAILRAELSFQEPISDRDMYPLGGTT